MNSDKRGLQHIKWSSILLGDNFTFKNISGVENSKSFLERS